MANHSHFCTDRVLPGNQMRLQSAVSRGGRTRAIVVIGKLWMNGSALRVSFLGGTAEQQTKAKEQAPWWTALANLTFEFPVRRVA